MYIDLCLDLVCRIEEVQLNRRDGIAKVLGTICSVAGALIITIYKGPIIFGPNSPLNQSQPSISLGDAEGKNWTLGCIGLIGHCICWSSWIVLQAPILKKYPAQLSLSSFTCFFAVLQFLAIAGLIERNSQAWLFHSGAELFCVLYSVCTINLLHHFDICTYVSYLLAVVMSHIVVGQKVYSTM